MSNSNRLQTIRNAPNGVGSSHPIFPGFIGLATFMIRQYARRPNPAQG
jgi:hypothetical protein